MEYGHEVKYLYSSRDAYGNNENHSYIVGVYTKKAAAIKAAEVEEEYRSGKYGCEVLEWTPNVGIAGDHKVQPKHIRQANGL